MSQNPVIAIVQFRTVRAEPDANIQRAENFIAQAAQQGASVIVFPEDFLTGSIFGDLQKLDRNKHFQKIFQALAKKYSIDIVAGSWMEERAGAALSTATYIDATGAVLGEYHKNHLFNTEKHFLTPGTEVSVFKTAYATVGLIICWDLQFPEIFSRMKLLGVEVVFCPSYWYAEIAGTGAALNTNAEAQTVDALCISRAVENTIILVYANAACEQRYPDGSVDTLIGHSQITAPFIGPLIKAADNSETMLVQEVDLSVLASAKEIYQL